MSYAKAAASNGLILASIGLALAWVGHALIDDAYIQLSYARNLIAHGTWGLLPERMSNTATAPLHVLTLALLGRPLESIADAARWLTALELFALYLVLRALSRRLFNRAAFGIVAFAGLLLNPLLLSTVGMETLLYTLLLLAACYAWVSARYGVTAILLALLTLTRPEGLLALVLMQVLTPEFRRWRYLATYAAVLVPWYVFSWLWLGNPLPDTFFIKTNQRSWDDAYFFNGLWLYWQRYPLPISAAFCLFPFAAGLVWNHDPTIRRLALFLASYGAAHFLSYSILGVPPYHWYYMHEVMVVVVLGALGLATVVPRVEARSHLAARWAVGIGVGLPVAFVFAMVTNLGAPLTEALIHTNWASPERYLEVATWLQAHTELEATIELDGEIGTMLFGSDRTLVDAFSDMNRATVEINRSRFVQTPLLRPISLLFVWRRTLPPLPPATYRLEQTVDQDVLPRRLEADTDDVVQSWATTSRWAPVGRIVLRRLQGPGVHDFQ